MGDSSRITVSRSGATGGDADEVFEEVLHATIHMLTQGERTWPGTTAHFADGSSHTGRLVGVAFVRPDHRHAHATNTGLAVAFEGSEDDGVLEFPLYSVTSIEFA